MFEAGQPPASGEEIAVLTLTRIEATGHLRISTSMLDLLTQRGKDRCIPYRAATAV